VFFLSPLHPIIYALFYLFSSFSLGRVTTASSSNWQYDMFLDWKSSTSTWPSGKFSAWHPVHFLTDDWPIHHLTIWSVPCLAICFVLCLAICSVPCLAICSVLPLAMSPTTTWWSGLSSAWRSASSSAWQSGPFLYSLPGDLALQCLAIWFSTFRLMILINPLTGDLVCLLPIYLVRPVCHYTHF
jgi:hypothetical protein